MNLLSVVNVSKKINDQRVLKQVSFVQQPLRKIAILGETGSGKSTLLKIIAGLIQADEGEVLLNGVRVLGPEEKLVPGHRAIAYLSQQYELRNAYRVEEVLAYANMLTNEEALQLYELCRITHLLKRRTDQLSGGEKQRIALCRLLISSPTLLLLDEPYSNLDMIHTGILKSVISNIADRLALSCIMVSHSPEDSLSWADEVIIMKNGEIIQQGIPQTIYRQPLNEHAAALLGKYNLFDPELVGLASRKKLFLRPEAIRIAPSGIEGRVIDVRYFGSYYELNISVNRRIVVVKTMNSSHHLNEIVFLNIEINDPWFL